MTCTLNSCKPQGKYNLVWESSRKRADWWRFNYKGRGYIFRPGFQVGRTRVGLYEGLRILAKGLSQPLEASWDHKKKGGRWQCRHHQPVRPGSGPDYRPVQMQLLGHTAWRLLWCHFCHSHSSSLWTSTWKGSTHIGFRSMNSVLNGLTITFISNEQMVNVSLHFNPDYMFSWHTPRGILWAAFCADPWGPVMAVTILKFLLSVSQRTPGHLISRREIIAV